MKGRHLNQGDNSVTTQLNSSAAMAKVKSIAPGQGETLIAHGTSLQTKICAADTDNTFFLIETVVNPGGGPPLHTHSNEDELFYVLEGTLAVEVLGQTHIAEAGSLAYLPRCIAHRFACHGDRPAKFLGFTTPPQFAGFLRAQSEAVAKPGFQFSDLVPIAEMYGLSLGPGNETVAPGGRVPVVLGPGGGSTLRFHDEALTIKLTAAQTGGMIGAYEVNVAPGGGPPAHVHDNCDELFYVLEGEFVFRVDGRDHFGRRGTTLYVPRGIAHHFRNIGKSTGKLLTIVSPGGFEGAFPKIADAAATGTLNPETIHRLGVEFETRYLLEQPQLSDLTVQAISNLRDQVAQR